MTNKKLSRYAKRRMKRNIIAAVAVVLSAAIFILSPVGVPTYYIAIDTIENIKEGYILADAEEQTSRSLDKIDESILQFAEADGLKLTFVEKIDTSKTHDVESSEITGIYNNNTKTIEITNTCRDATVALHEYGHYVDHKVSVRVTGKRASMAEEFVKVAEKEIEQYNDAAFLRDTGRYSLNNYRHTGTFGEYFAETFADYLMYPRFLKACAPETYKYMDMFYNTIAKEI